MAPKRLRKELLMLQREPVPLAVAAPLESNILEWRFLMQGVGVYYGGYYMGKLVFPPEYPLKPPSIMFITPSGRFDVNKRICLSISDFHPETWAPSWTVGTILTGIVSFFNSEESTVGSVNRTEAERKKYAQDSMAFNLKDKTFVKLFGTDCSQHFPPPRATAAAAAAAPTPSSAAPDAIAGAGSSPATTTSTPTSPSSSSSAQSPPSSSSSSSSSSAADVVTEAVAALTIEGTTASTSAAASAKA